jgi:hypothetical protein
MDHQTALVILGIGLLAAALLGFTAEWIGRQRR